MKPRDILLNNINLHLKDRLAEAGFRYLKSGPSFKRDYSHFQQELIFCLNRYNSENTFEFWSVWNVRSKEYAFWHAEKFGTPPSNGSIWGKSDWNIEGWCEIVPSNTILNISNEPKKMKEFWDACILAGIPELDKFSNHMNAAIELEKGNNAFGKVKAVHLHLLNNKNDLALSKAKEFAAKIEANEFVDQSMELVRLKEVIKYIEESL
jgi:hypothetical protein